MKKDISLLKKKFLDLGRSKKYWNSGRGVWFYCKNELFPKIDFENKNFLDIGAGKGIYSIYATIMGAKKVVALEPEVEGSSPEVRKNFEEMISELNLTNINIINRTFQDFNSEDKFDIILFHNSINHLDEEKCKILHIDNDAQKEYKKIIVKLRAMSNKGGKVIVTDCARENFSTRMGFKRGSFYNHTIEWEKHQNPKLWIELFEKSGFKLIKVSYKGQPRLLYLSYLLKNRFIAFLRWNQFILFFEAI